jgi:hypothetical protein
MADSFAERQNALYPNQLMIGNTFARRGDELTTTQQARSVCVTIFAEYAQLSADDCVRLGTFLLAAANRAREAKERADNLTRESTRNAPNVCKSCGHINNADNRGWCNCTHCGALMDRGPFPGQSAEEHAARGHRTEHAQESTTVRRMGDFGVEVVEIQDERFCASCGCQGGAHHGWCKS